MPRAQSAIENLERLEQAFDEVKGQLFGQLHDKVRAQLFDKAPPVGNAPRPMALLNGSTQPVAADAALQNGSSSPHQPAQRQ